MSLVYSNTRNVIKSIIAVSMAISGCLIWLIYFKSPPRQFAQSLTFLPALNALLNGLSAVCVCCGLASILKRKVHIHMRFMIAALICSSLFLVSYITHHYLHGDTPFLGMGLIRPVYFTILITHVTLSVVVLPMIFITFFLALTRQFRLHKRVARITFPIWLYVSITGVVVFLLLRSYAS